MDLTWFRWPTENEPPAQLVDVTETEVIEAITADARFRVEHPVGTERLHVWSVTTEQRPIFVWLVRTDRFGMWRTRVARPMNAAERALWMEETG